MVRYVKCPRCELNYIDAETQEFCDVCIAEIKGNKLQFADLDDDEEFVDELEDEKTELCPVCGTKYMRYGETMCDSCKKLDEYEEDVDIDPDKDEEWKNYLDDDTDDLTADDEILDEDLRNEFADDEEEEEETFDEYQEEDDLDDFDEGDFDDDFDDEDDDDDDDDDF